MDGSGQSGVYKQLKIFFKYIFNEEENIMNPLEIYEYINNNFKNRNKTKEEINFNLYYKIKDKIIKNRTLVFMNNFNIFNEKYKYEFIHQMNTKISLFSYPYNIDQWINYQLLDINKKRLFPSFYEYITIVLNGNKMKDLIMKRYHYGNKNITKQNKIKMIKFRDAIDMEKEYNKTKILIDKSLIEEKEKCENSYETSFNQLLNIIGHSKDKIYEVNNEENKKEKSGFENKIFNSPIGSYIHFKKDIFLFEQPTIFNYSKSRELIDIFFEDNLKFYEELDKITIIFKNNTINLINNIINIKIKNNLTNFI